MRLTAGLKVERNSYTGREYLPHLNLAWQLAPSHMAWASLARAVRVPSRIDRDFQSPSAPPLVDGLPQYIIAGGPDFISEVAKVAQFGLRGQPTAALSYALTVHASRYQRLRTLETNPDGPGLVFLNRAGGDSHGAELSARWDVRPYWRLTAGLSAQSLDTRAEAGSRDQTAAVNLASNDPAVWATLRSSFDVSDRLELDFNLRHVGELPQPVVPAYTALDVRLGWKMTRRAELSLLARNLLAPRHAEFGAAPGRPVYGRTLQARLSWRH
ncbi:TonB-dependent receptor plug domain-containing protein [Massilia glaciei]|uniref:TonB-dependent receptor plug domain-containing protein n=1 Tax=Massilia glaciei TaxID=1524097 RepID=UPI0015E816AA|nr:TonB-dependent receptor [Massilia glaciei]